MCTERLERVSWHRRPDAAMGANAWCFEEPSRFKSFSLGSRNNSFKFLLRFSFCLHLRIYCFLMSFNGTVCRRRQVKHTEKCAVDLLVECQMKDYQQLFVTASAFKLLKLTEINIVSDFYANISLNSCNFLRAASSLWSDRKKWNHLTPLRNLQKRKSFVSWHLR